MRRIFFLLAIILIGCQNSDETTVYFEPVNIERLDQKIMQVQSESELQNLLGRERLLTELFYDRSPEDPQFISALYSIIQYPEAKEVYKQSLDVFGDLTKLSSDFGRAFAEIRKHYPDFKEPRIVVAFSGLINDMIINDSLVIISLESFIGEEAVLRPDEPDYILKRFTPDHIVPGVVRYLSNQFNHTDFSKDNFVTDMVFFGKSLEFSREVLPHFADSLIIGYSNLDMQNAYENQDYIWGHVIDRELLNEDNAAVLAKYFGERPYIAEISPDCPPRIGQWLGWRIVELYKMNNPEVSLTELMNIQDPEVILRGSKYRGQKNG